MSVVIPTVSRRELALSGFDAYLGAAQHRYLGDGHRRVELELTKPSRVGEFDFACNAQVFYPEDWSQKAGAGRVPHLSTVDAIRIAGHVRDALAGAAVFGDFTDERSLTVRAGARPWEDLDGVPVRTVLTPAPEGGELILQHSIGSLRVESRLVRAAVLPAVDDVWEPGEASGIRFDAQSGVQCTYDRSSSRPSVMSFLEAMMLAAQMSQVALYGGDPSVRDRSGNMWMRRASFVRHTPQLFRTGVVELQLLNRRDLMVAGRAIGTAEVLAEDVFGVQVTASLATGS